VADAAGNVGMTNVGVGDDALELVVAVKVVPSVTGGIRDMSTFMDPATSEDASELVAVAIGPEATFLHPTHNGLEVGDAGESAPTL